MLPRKHPDRIQIAFDDHRLVANAGLLLPVTLAQHLGLRQLVDSHVDLGDALGRANTGDKMMTLVASALAGGDCIADADGLDDVTYRYQWIANNGTMDSDLQDATASTYTPSVNDLGKTIKVKVSFTDTRTTVSP